MASTHFVLGSSRGRNNTKQLHRPIWPPNSLACSLCTNLLGPDMHIAFPQHFPVASKAEDGKCHSYELFEKMLPVPFPPTCCLPGSTKG